MLRTHLLSLSRELGPVSVECLQGGDRQIAVQSCSLSLASLSSFPYSLVGATTTTMSRPRFKGQGRLLFTAAVLVGMVFTILAAVTVQSEPNIPFDRYGHVLFTQGSSDAATKVVVAEALRLLLQPVGSAVKYKYISINFCLEPVRL